MIPRWCFLFFIFIQFALIDTSVVINAQRAYAQDFDDDFDDIEGELADADDDFGGDDSDFDEDFDDESSDFADFDDEDFSDDGDSFSDNESDSDEGFDDFGESEVSDADFDDFGSDEDEAANEAVSNEDSFTDEEEIFSEPPIVEDVANTQVPQPQNISTPNSSYEQNLFNIYEKFYRFPVPSTDWAQLTGDRYSEVYNIQSGDTLWDISATFFGDGNFWPKIWSVNNRITNPHIISTGNNIAFNIGTVNTPPQFAISPENNTTAEGAVKVERDSKAKEVINRNAFLAANGEIKIPPPQIKRQGVLQVLPNSVPLWNYNPPMVTDIQHYGANAGDTSKYTMRSAVKYFVRDTEAVSSGQVTEAEATETLAIAGQYVYLDILPNSDADRFLVVESLGKITPNKDWSTVEGPFGFAYKVLGEVTVSDKVKAEDDKSLYRAYVETAYSPISAGAMLIPEDLVKFNVPRQGGDFNFTSGQVIGGSFTKSSMVLTQGMFAFVNRGAADGLEEGDKVMFVSQRKTYKTSSKVIDRLFKTGEGLVVDSDDKVATVYIYKAKSEILVGDYIGEPAFLNGSQGAASSNSDDAFGDEDEGFESDEGFGDSDDFGGDDSSIDDDFGSKDDDDFGGDEDFDSGSDEGFGEGDFSEGDGEGFDDDAQFSEENFDDESDVDADFGDF